MTRELGGGRAGEALTAYRDHGMVHGAETRDQARVNLIEGWTRDRAKAPEQTRIILTHTNDEFRTLNDLARARLREAGELGEDVSIQIERGKRDFACGDRVMFLKNDRGLGIKNGSLGVVETVREHMPSSHRRYADWTPERLRRQAGQCWWGMTTRCRLDQDARG